MEMWIMLFTMTLNSYKSNDIYDKATEYVNEYEPRWILIKLINYIIWTSTAEQ